LKFMYALLRLEKLDRKSSWLFALSLLLGLQLPAKS